MDDLADVFNDSNENRETRVFKKPVLIGKRPGAKVSGNKQGNPPNPPNCEEEYEMKTGAEIGNEEKQNVDSSLAAQDKTNNSAIKAERKVEDVNKNRTSNPPYSEPLWSGLCTENFGLEILKNGTIVQQEDLTNKPFYLVGRLPSCSFVLEHPSISRFHAVLQYCPTTEVDGHEKGWYLYDLESTHGTYLNKQKIQPRVFVRIRAGHTFKFGASTRLFILQGPEEDQEAESELTVTQLKELREKRESLMNDLMDGEERDGKAGYNSLASKLPSKESDGIDWGMGEDAQDENPNGENPFAVIEECQLNEELYLDDPKKTLRGWFEREGYELEYKVEEKNYAHFVCRVDLPIDTANGAPIIAEASVKGGKKKEAVVQCALEACRILDRHGLLRQSTHESKGTRRKRRYDEDYYSSDEDTFLDRTGAAERKRQAKLKGKSVGAVETYESLMQKFQDNEKEMARIQEEIASCVASSTSKEANAEDDLDSYMSSLQAEMSRPKKSAASLRAKLHHIEKEQVKLRSLINVAKPAALPELKPSSSSIASKPIARPKTIPEKTVKPSQQSTEAIQVSNKEDTLKPSTKPVETHITDVTPSAEPVVANMATDEVVSKPRATVLPPPPVSQKQPSTAKAEPAKSKQQNPKPAVSESPREEKTSEQTKTAGLVIRKREKTVKKKESTVAEEGVEYDASDVSKYAMWLPPEDQSGDGKTALNRKLGY